MTVSSATPTTIEAWFTEPDQAVSVIEGLRTARCLLDRNQAFAGLQQQALDFA